MSNVEINGKLVGQCESAGKASSPLFKDIIDPWIEIEGFVPASPSLTDDQQVLLDELKTDQNGWYPFFTIWHLMEETDSIHMPTKEQFQVLAAFAEWGCKSNE